MRRAVAGTFFGGFLLFDFVCQVAQNCHQTNNPIVVLWNSFAETLDILFTPIGIILTIIFLIFWGFDFWKKDKTD
jgi:hypothetical protein